MIGNQQVRAALRVSWYRRKSVRRTIFHLTVYAVSITLSVIFLLPLFWTLSSSFKPRSEILVFPPKWVPSRIEWRNYSEAMTILPFSKYALNSGIICSLVILGFLLTTPLAGFAFARLRFPGRGPLFILVLMGMMLPFEVTMIPLYLFFSKLHWVDTIKPLVVPPFFAAGSGGAFFIFLLRQYFLTIPKEMYDAAKIDGCTTLQMYLRIYLPQAKPALGIIAIYSFMWNWNDFLGPFIYLRNMQKFTFAVGLSFFQGMFFVYWHLLMAASVVAIVPCVIIFFIAQKAFIQGIVVTGLKG